MTDLPKDVDGLPMRDGDSVLLNGSIASTVTGSDGQRRIVVELTDGTHATVKPETTRLCRRADG